VNHDDTRPARIAQFARSLNDELARRIATYLVTFFLLGHSKRARLERRYLPAKDNPRMAGIRGGTAGWRDGGTVGARGEGRGAPDSRTCSRRHCLQLTVGSFIRRDLHFGRRYTALPLRRAVGEAIGRRMNERSERSFNKPRGNSEREMHRAQ